MFWNRESECSRIYLIWNYFQKYHGLKKLEEARGGKWRQEEARGGKGRQEEASGGKWRQVEARGGRKRHKWRLEEVGGSTSFEVKCWKEGAISKSQWKSLWLLKNLHYNTIFPNMTHLHFCKPILFRYWLNPSITIRLQFTIKTWVGDNTYRSSSNNNSVVPKINLHAKNGTLFYLILSNVLTFYSDWLYFGTVSNSLW